MKKIALVEYGKKILAPDDGYARLSESKRYERAEKSQLAAYKKMNAHEHPRDAAKGENAPVTSSAEDPLIFGELILVVARYRELIFFGDQWFERRYSNYGCWWKSGGVRPHR